ncbi:zinc-binding dehydrogenase [Cellulomonas uda]|uniref:NAD(P)H quinone oxidoreductase n=1 Tax=Cellulomonas uda TaxID=1714 RepID=A0A4Y3KAU4_CELUD|nr:zinc-binding dehydrogenase [Cellulomonas uda]NII66139.1 putative PIG3 family NAD(P)H quinone oxidoreductase [Cellulomonas uda]GEA81611.1 NAD(P)H quinone oxidoreductase [Cellulomonas uda]
MRAVVITEPGGPEVLRVRDVPEPDPGPDEVTRLLVDVEAAGVNRADLLQRQGVYPPPAGAPPWPGLEAAGVVRAVLAARAGAAPGPDEPTPAVGDRVAVLLAGGGYAERVVVPAALALPVPRDLTSVAAAALPEALATVWSNLREANAAPGETLLVRGGSGGVGSVAVRLGRLLGLRVLATAGGPARVARVAELGADVALDHRADDLADQVLAATDGRGVDVVLDVVGAAALEDNVRVLASGGRLVVIGLQKGRRGTLDLGVLMERRARVIGTTLRSRDARDKARIMAEVREHVWPFVVDGRLRPVVHATLGLDEAGRAHELLASGEVFGKPVLTVDEPGPTGGA